MFDGTWLVYGNILGYFMDDNSSITVYWRDQAEEIL